MAPLALKDGRCGEPPGALKRLKCAANASNLLKQVWQQGSRAAGLRREADNLTGVPIPPINCSHYGFFSGGGALEWSVAGH